MLWNIKAVFESQNALGSKSEAETHIRLEPVLYDAAFVRAGFYPRLNRMSES
jgi:hypothetical protein